MNYMNKTLFVICAILMITACEKQGEPDLTIAQIEAFEKLSGNWSLGTAGSIMLDGSNISGNYAGFVLSFTDGGYTTTNAGDLFNATGTWEWSNPDAGEIILDTDRSITINSLTTTQFVFSFTFSGTGSVSSGTGGEYVITVVR
jgi:hypothetical protein